MFCISVSDCRGHGAASWRWPRRAGAALRASTVEQYTIDAEITPTSIHRAKAVVRFTPLDETSPRRRRAEQPLNISRVLDAQDKQIPASRQPAGFHRRLTSSSRSPRPAGHHRVFLRRRLTGRKDSPVEALSRAIHPDFAYLMYPARWFP